MASVVVPQAQQPVAQPTFRTGSLLIVETVTVKDKAGNAVEGLTASDFALTEDGEPQVISFVEFQRLPGPGQSTVPGAVAPPTLSPPPAAGAAVGPPAQALLAVPPPGDTRYRDRRLLVLYFDPSAMPPPDQMRAYTNALKFVDTQMSPADAVAIVTFQAGAVRVRQDFTDNRALLREVIQLLIFGNDQDGDGFPDPLPGTAFGQDDGEFNIFNTDRQLAALQTAVTMLRPIPGQKSLIFFASGLRLNGTDNQAQLRATVNAAVRANVAIHTIDARGLVAAAPLGDATRPSPGGIGIFNGRTADALSSSFQRSQDSLYALAKDTGGRPMFDYNDLSLGIVQAAESMTSYYLIGYYSTHSAEDGRFRRVKVSLNGRVEGELSYRQGYFADKAFAKFTAADKERQLEDALMLENPITDIPIAMEVNYFQLNRAQYFIPVAVKIPGSELALARRGGAQRTLIDFIGEVKDEYGYTMQNVRDKLDIKLSDGTAAQLATRPIQYETGFTLLPGKYADQAARPRLRNRANGHVSDGVYRAQSGPRRAARPDQLGRPREPACGARRRALHGAAEARRGRCQPARLQRTEADSERHPGVQPQPRPARVPSGVRTCRHHHAAAGRVCRLLPGADESVRNAANCRDRRSRSENQSRPAAVHAVHGPAAAGAVRLPGHRARPDRPEGGVLAGADRRHPVV